jgi:hypothetical protein
MLLAMVATPVSAADWPTFKAGQWTFERTMSGAAAPRDKMSTSECTDPTADQKVQQTMLTKAGASSRP